MRRTQDQRRRRGSVLVVLAGSLTLLLACAAWTVDMAVGLQARTSEQAACDAAALAGVLELVPPSTPAKRQAATDAAIRYATLNGEPISAADVTIWKTATGAEAITVTRSRSVGTYFASALGTTAYPVAARASAVLGGPRQIPAGWVPLGLPGFRGGDDQWYGLDAVDPDRYTALTYNADSGQGTRVLVKVTANGANSGNFLALSLSGRGGRQYREDVANGGSVPIAFGEVVDSQPGNMVGPTEQALRERIAAGRVNLLVPLIDRNDWAANHGRGQVRVIGFIAARLVVGTGKGREVYAEFQRRLVAAPASSTTSASPSVYSPVLILTP